MKIVKLRDKSNSIQITPNEALQAAIDTKIEKTQALIILYDDKNREYEFWQGGGISLADTLWHIEQYKMALLEGRIEELE